MVRNSKNPDCTTHYSIEVRDWETHASFNDYAYINIFDEHPFEERVTLCLIGKLSFDMPKLKAGCKVKVVLFPNEFWSKSPLEVKDNEPIGNFELMRNHVGNSKEMILYFRVSMPVKSYDLILSSLVGGKLGEASLAGSELYRRKGKVYQLSYNSNSIKI